MGPGLATPDEVSSCQAVACGVRTCATAGGTGVGAGSALFFGVLDAETHASAARQQNRGGGVLRAAAWWRRSHAQETGFSGSQTEEAASPGGPAAAPCIVLRDTTGNSQIGLT